MDSSVKFEASPERLKRTITDQACSRAIEEESVGDDIALGCSCITAEKTDSVVCGCRPWNVQSDVAPACSCSVRRAKERAVAVGN